jgi:hypothetical protein
MQVPIPATTHPHPSTQNGCPILRASCARRVGKHARNPPQSISPQHDNGCPGCLAFGHPGKQAPNPATPNPHPSTQPGCPILRASCARRVGKHAPTPTNHRIPCPPLSPTHSSVILSGAPQGPREQHHRSWGRRSEESAVQPSVSSHTTPSPARTMGAQVRDPHEQIFVRGVISRRPRSCSCAASPARKWVPRVPRFWAPGKARPLPRQDSALCQGTTSVVPTKAIKFTGFYWLRKNSCQRTVLKGHD